MKAVVLYSPGPPEALVIEQRPIPVPKEGQVLIRVKAFGLNRSGNCWTLRTNARVLCEMLTFPCERTLHPPRSLSECTPAADSGD